MALYISICWCMGSLPNSIYQCVWGPSQLYISIYLVIIFALWMTSPCLYTFSLFLYIWCFQKCLITFQTHVERYFGSKIKAIQSNGGGEFQALKAYFKNMVSSLVSPTPKSPAKWLPWTLTPLYCWHWPSYPPSLFLYSSSLLEWSFYYSFLSYK